MDVKKFKRGGVHPAASKYTAALPITKANMPQVVRIPMAMHMGAPAACIVKAGAKVEEGQLIGEAAGFVSANVHSSVSGEVVSVAKGDTMYVKGLDFVEIKTGGSIRNWMDKKNDYTKMKPEALLEKVKAAGIVGLGGATFPTHVKLMPPKDAKLECVIINGTECEPYLTADHRLMLEKHDELLEGIRILKMILGVKQAWIGIEDNKEDAILKLQEVTADDSTTQVVPLRTMYPQGGEKQLIEAILGREVPSGALPSAVGAVVMNVSTTIAIYEAVVFDKPLIERVMTYTGEDVVNKGNYKVRIGTPFSQIFHDYGMPESYGEVIHGGPMMGTAFSDFSHPIIKGSGGLLILPKQKDYIVHNNTCIRCSRCYSVCPTGLEPAYLGKLCDHNKVDEAVERGLLDCIECGSCAFVCPAAIPLVGLYRFAKMQYRRKQAQAK